MVAAAAVFFVGGLRAETPLVFEVEGRIARCPAELMARTLGAVGVRDDGGVLTEAQAQAVFASLEEGKAQFLSRPLVVTSSGVSGEAKAVVEFRFPIEFEKNPKTGKQVPTVFEARDVGTTVRYTPVVSSGGDLALAIDAEQVRLRGFQEEDGGRKRPIFSESEVVAHVQLHDGETVVTRFYADTIEGEAGGAEESGFATFLFSTARIVPAMDGGTEP